MATKKAAALNDELFKLQDENTKLKAMVYNLQEGNKQLEVVINDLKTAIQELANELEYVRIIKDSAEKTLKEVREENKKLKAELERIKQRVKEHTTYSVKAEFIKKFWE